jgi:hypothetical protein
VAGPSDFESFLEALADDLNTAAAVAILDRAEARGEDWTAEGREILRLGVNPP